jgi:hypothetical protein
MARRFALASAAFLAVMAGVIYGVLDTGFGRGAVALIYVLIVVVHFAYGYATATWWALLLPPLVVLIALPADSSDFLRGALDPSGMVLIAIGVGLARMWGRQSATRA